MNDSQTTGITKSHKSNKKLIVVLCSVVVGMFGFGFAMVPLYDVFCEVLGIRLPGDGTGQVSAQQSEQLQTQEDRWITVQFDSTVDSALPWEFSPGQKFMRVKVGELSETHYLAENTAQRAVVGHAVPSIAPAEASIYFAKTECFCFTQQQLQAGEQRDMPVRFIIDPDIPKNIKVLTLSYRFYKSGQENDQLAVKSEG